LAAVALQTRRLTIGTMVTPLARRRPWKVARETVSLDRLFGGRLVLGVGLGDPAQWDYGFFGEDTDARLRAAWSGMPSSGAQQDAGSETCRARCSAPDQARGLTSV
jgi:alkanesulfonate monooxygenase SsuD/methylene tetrahydromethanopterin reductase-like flavin-dependent oxidoreductase (luciferase family)